ncbi:hypothetical protein LB565_08330 [Mesorhizobium sp. CA14]|uniref:hypothetical protein n=1 Tax=Mesorhizobium sp. CA14 TaxID=2876642 RepID=UPI001CCF25C8|nr:hypothetical protein [Mesorhizobium sp. CA14]MBZ9847990.1 hypothetical protein [Mesorhizobium sp. CA14]
MMMDIRQLQFVLSVGSRSLFANEACCRACFLRTDVSMLVLKRVVAPVRDLLLPQPAFKLFQEMSFIEELFPISTEALNQIRSLCFREIRFSRQSAGQEVEFGEIGLGQTAIAVLHRLGDNLEHAADFLVNLADLDSLSVRSFHRLVGQIAYRGQGRPSPLRANALPSNARGNWRRVCSFFQKREPHIRFR